MKYIPYVLLLACLCACETTAHRPLKPAEAAGKPQPPAPEDPTPIPESMLLQHFKLIHFDTLAVYVPAGKERPGLDDARYQFHGVALDSETKAFLLPADLRKSVSAYACTSFPLDSGRIALISRMTGNNGAGRLHLQILDNAQGELTDVGPLADEDSDEGQLWNLRCWLFWKGHTLWQLACTQQSEAGDTAPYRSYQLFKLENERWELMEEDSAVLTKQFPHLHP